MKILKWPIIYLISQTVLLFVFILCHTLFEINIPLEIFIQKYRFILAIILFACLFPFLIKEYKKKQLTSCNMKFKSILLIFIYGVSLSIIFNTLMFYISKFLPINLFSYNNYLLSSLLAIGLCGPILEEYTFRGIIYNDLKSRYSNMKSIIISTLLFTFLHFSFVQMIYAFAFSFLLIFLYEKYKNMKAPIILHIASNITSVILVNVLNFNNITLNYILYLVSLIVFIVISLFYKKNML